MSDTGSAEHSPKNDAQVEQPNTEVDPKKAHSYTYWVKHQPNFYGENAVNIQPKKVEEDQAKTLKAKEETKTDGHSAWNTAGTWEEKKLNGKFFQEVLEKALIGYKNKDGNLEITAINDVTGEGRLIVSRGKKRIGFELGIVIEYTGRGNLEGGQGTIRYREFQEDGDHEHEIEVDEGDEKRKDIQKAVESSLKAITELTLNTLLKLKD